MRSGILVASTTIVLLVCSCGRGNEQRAGSEADRIRAAMAREKVPGLVLATFRNCRVESIQTFGTANVENGTPVNGGTLFEAASLSKPVLAYLYLRLVDQGVLPLDEPLAGTFDYPRASHDRVYASLTPRHILTHRSGLPNWAEDRKTGEPAPLRFKRPPGEGFTYSGEGFQMLQSYMEARTGASYESLFVETLGQDMPKSAFGFDVPPGTVVATAYRSDGTAATDRPLKAHNALSLRTTIGDFARFMERVCSGEGLRQETWNEMLRPSSPAPLPAWRTLIAPVGGDVSWGLGWGVLRVGDRTLCFHWGDNGAFKDMVVFDRDSGNGFVYFSNGEGGLDLLETVGDPILAMSLKPIRRWVH